MPEVCVGFDFKFQLAKQDAGITHTPEYSGQLSLVHNNTSGASVIMCMIQSLPPLLPLQGRK